MDRRQHARPIEPAWAILSLARRRMLALTAGSANSTKCTQAGSIMPEEPEVVAGETVFDSIAHPQEQQEDRQQSLIVVVRTYRGLPGQTETMHSVVSQHTLPAITDAPGFRGFYAFRDDADPDRAISITLFGTREEAMRSHEAVVGIMRERLGEMAYRVPRVTMGETVVLATV